MSGLFDTLSARFSAESSVPAIRPRTRLRFEDSMGGSGDWGEVVTEQPNESASTPSMRTPSGNVSAVGNETRTAEAAPQQKKQSDSSDRTRIDQRLEPAARETPMKKKQHASEPSPVHLERTVEIHHTKETGPGKALSDRKYQINTVPAIQKPTVESLTNTQPESSTGPPASRNEFRATQPDEHSSVDDAITETHDAPMPESIDETANTTRIHIGRIDVRMPAPPKITVAAPPKRRSLGARTAARRSTPLTDYLGWKR